MSLAETVWSLSDQQLLHLTNFGYLDLALPRKKQRISLPPRANKIRFYAPSFAPYKTNYFSSPSTAFPSISVTGSFCTLKCKHCGGKVLNTMIPTFTPKELITLCKKLKDKGAVGCLISGGCLPDGSVPLVKFIDAIAKIKRDTGLTVVAHTGVVDLPTARRFKEAGIDAALIDVVGSNETIREIYRLNINVEDYDRALKAFHIAGVPVVPHVLVGLHYGKLKGEFRALKMISKYKHSAVIIIALTPIPGTPLSKVDPPTPTDIARVVVTTRFMLPKTPLGLGCMRPKGEHKIETDTLAIKGGVDAVAFPANEAVRLAESSGLEIVFSSLCCSQIFDDIER